MHYSGSGLMTDKDKMGMFSVVCALRCVNNVYFITCVVHASYKQTLEIINC